MRIMHIVPLIILIGLISCQTNKQKSKSPFVQVKNNAFVLDGEHYCFSGANYWQGMNLGAEKSGNRERLIKELDHMKSLGITNLRVLAASEGGANARYCVQPALQTAPGVFNSDVFEGLDFFLNEMAKRDMKAVMVLSNFWTWSGGFPQFLEWAGADSIPYPQEPPYDWTVFTNYSCEFYLHEAAQDLYFNTIKEVINRTNTINGIKYKNDPTIMSWQLANEPRGYLYPEAYRKWIKKSAALIKSLDTNHLVCIGSEGNTDHVRAGVNVELDNQIENIDYITLHVWAQNWMWLDPQRMEETLPDAKKKVEEYIGIHIEAANKLKKPMVLEEFGIARDGGSFEPSASTQARDAMFQYYYNVVKDNISTNGPIKGINFWSYAGFEKPVTPGEFWKKGEPLIGDPPHELQGWYSVYNDDKSTIRIIEDFHEFLQNN